MTRLLNDTKYPPFKGHKHLYDLKQKALPFWESYLANKEKDIQKLKKQLSNL